jgi:hypothetical protein
MAAAQSRRVRAARPLTDNSLLPSTGFPTTNRDERRRRLSGRRRALLRQLFSQAMILLAVVVLVSVMGAVAFGTYRVVQSSRDRFPSSASNVGFSRTMQPDTPVASQPTSKARTASAGSPADSWKEFVSAHRGYPNSFRHFRPFKSPAELKGELAAVPELLLEPKRGGATRELTAHAQDFHGTARSPAPFPRLLASRDDFAGLPFGMNAECYLWDGPALRLESLSKALHQYLDEAETRRKQYGEAFTDESYISSKLAQDGDSVWRVPEAVPTLVQILQAQDIPLRRLLVRYLAGIRGEGATEALARFSVFDVSAMVREEAVFALRTRPAGDYRDVLLAGLRYPWPAAAEHAAEALVNLNQVELAPQMVAMLSEPDPALPQKWNNEERSTIRELVQVNHLKNCLLCHAVSAETKDHVRGFVPEPERPITAKYYQNSSGLFARADVTYLRQDFSVLQSVPNNGELRFDYVVRNRPATAEEIVDAQKYQLQGAKSFSYPQREAVLYALRELTGQKLSEDAAAWTAWLRSAGRGK